MDKLKVAKVAAYSTVAVGLVGAGLVYLRERRERELPPVSLWFYGGMDPKNPDLGRVSERELRLVRELSEEPRFA